jgi:hypothetical protein
LRCSPPLPLAHSRRRSESAERLRPTRFLSTVHNWAPSHCCSKPRSSVNQRCDVRLGFEKSIDRAELDCIAKNTFAIARTWLLRLSVEHPGTLSLLELVVHTITSCRTTSPNISLQVVRALFALVLSPNILVHQRSGLSVKAVRGVYITSFVPLQNTVVVRIELFRAPSAGTYGQWWCLLGSFTSRLEFGRTIFNLSTTQELTFLHSGVRMARGLL